MDSQLAVDEPGKQGAESKCPDSAGCCALESYDAEVPRAQSREIRLYRELHAAGTVYARVFEQELFATLGVRSSWIETADWKAPTIDERLRTTPT